MSIYRAWGFDGNPLSSLPIEANERGELMCVGRERELTTLINRIRTPPKIATIEGPNGVGKTSLINVAAFRIFRDDLTRATEELLVPCRRSFQLTEKTDAESFRIDVLLEVAQTLFERQQELRQAGLNPSQNKTLERWMNSPDVASWGAQLGASELNAGVSRTPLLNTSEGFNRSGFARLVSEWLAQTFPRPDSGGVLCVIDNLELLRTSKSARDVLETIRDDALNLPGLRWVFAGAKGIMLSVARSPRLEGYLHKPIELGGIAHTEVGQVLPKRIRGFEVQPGMGELPISPQDFELVYETFGRNLRHALSRADDFCMYASERGQLPSQSRVNSEFLSWQDKDAAEVYSSIRSELTERPWQVFLTAVSLDRSFSPGEYEVFEANSQMALRPHLAELERVSLIESAQDETDKRRRNVNLTAKAYLVKYHHERQSQGGHS